RLYDNYLGSPLLFVLPLLAVAGLAGQRLLLAGSPPRAFAASCLMVVGVTFTGVAGLFPNLIPSRLDVTASLTIFNSSSSLLTLKIMTVVAFVFVPIVIAYKVWVYRVFRAPVTVEEVRRELHPY
ncbi:MAG TPA: cytochrome d ubiquinol oxidase subunit II, partial [Verrucomicrobiae bacterium]|nr:cytochrome d ubiquinol oxidase subunit II [Verrucomicrobiae bacterium]